MSEQEHGRGEEYEPPRVERMPAEDGPAVTAAGTTGEGPEWRPSGEGEETESERP